jgi:hypothetical protein
MPRAWLTVSAIMDADNATFNGSGEGCIRNHKGK